MSIHEIIRQKKLAQQQEEACKTQQRAVLEAESAQRLAQQQAELRQKALAYDQMIPTIYEILRRGQIEETLQGILQHANSQREYRGRVVNIPRKPTSFIERFGHEKTWDGLIYPLERREDQVEREAKLTIEKPEDITQWDQNKIRIVEMGKFPYWTAQLLWEVSYWNVEPMGNLATVSGWAHKPEGFYVRMSPKGIDIALRARQCSTSGPGPHSGSLSMLEFIHPTCIPNVDNPQLIKEALVDAYLGTLQPTPIPDGWNSHMSIFWK